MSAHCSFSYVFWRGWLFSYESGIDYFFCWNISSKF